MTVRGTQCAVHSAQYNQDTFQCNFLRTSAIHGFYPNPFIDYFALSYPEIG